MKAIAVDARPLVPPLKGIGRYASKILFELIECTPEWRWILYGVAEIPIEWKGFSNVTVRQFSNSPGALSIVFSQCLFYLWLLRDRPDLFWSPRHHLPIFRVRNIKYFLTIHDLVWVKRPDTMTFKRWFLERLLMPRSIRLADYVFFVSNSTRVDVEEKFGGIRGSVVYPSSVFQNQVYRFSPESNQKVFLFVGTWEPRKNLPRIIEAFRVVANRGDDVRLKIVGQKGWGRENISDLVYSLSLGDFVDFVDSPDDHELAEIYAGAYVLLFPSLYEGFGIPILEAMSFGVPAIASDISSMPEVVSDAGVLINPEETSDIVNAMFTLLDDPRFYRALSENAYRRSKDFSWEHSASLMLEKIDHSLSD